MSVSITTLLSALLPLLAAGGIVLLILSLVPVVRPYGRKGRRAGRGFLQGL